MLARPAEAMARSRPWLALAPRPVLPDRGNGSLAARFALLAAVRHGGWRRLLCRLAAASHTAGRRSVDPVVVGQALGHA